MRHYSIDVLRNLAKMFLGDVPECLYLQEKVLLPLSRSVEEAVQKILPEVDSLSVSCASPYESPTIEQTIKKAFT